MQMKKARIILLWCLGGLCFICWIIPNSPLLIHHSLWNDILTKAPAWNYFFAAIISISLTQVHSDRESPKYYSLPIAGCCVLAILWMLNFIYPFLESAPVWYGYGTLAVLLLFPIIFILLAFLWPLRPERGLWCVANAGSIGLSLYLYFCLRGLNTGVVRVSDPRWILPLHACLSMTILALSLALIIHYKIGSCAASLGNGRSPKSVA